MEFEKLLFFISILVKTSEIQTINNNKYTYITTLNRRYILDSIGKFRDKPPASARSRSIIVILYYISGY